MYQQFFGLNEQPFSIAVNPRYLFMSARHRDALAHLLYGVGSGGGFILLTGEVGTGKTTLNRCLLEQMPEHTDIAIVLNPALSAVELLATVCDEFEIDYPSGTDSLKVLTDSLHQFLLSNHRADRRTVLMIDEAQHLGFDVLEQIRLLTNLETDEKKLLQIILTGQPELASMLSRPELRQLNQRITARFDLTPLDRAETRTYVQHRLNIAGNRDDRVIFSVSAVREIYRLSGGVPRLINLLCDRAMMGAYGRQQDQVSAGLIREAAAEVWGSAPAGHGRSGRGGRWAWILAAVVALSGLAAFVTGSRYLQVADRAEVPSPSRKAARRWLPYRRLPRLVHSSLLSRQSMRRLDLGCSRSKMRSQPCGSFGAVRHCKFHSARQRWATACSASDSRQKPGMRSSSPTGPRSWP